MMIWGLALDAAECCGTCIALLQEQLQLARRRAREHHLDGRAAFHAIDSLHSLCDASRRPLTGIYPAVIRSTAAISSAVNCQPSASAF